MHIHYFGSKILRERCEEVTLFDETLLGQIAEMKRLMDESHGTGLAAPQVGLARRFFVARLALYELGKEEQWLKAPIEVFVNPHFSQVSDEMLEDEEGCLSLPSLRANVWRPSSLVIKAQDETGAWFERRYEGRPARILMHENDHLNGVLYFDRLNSREKKRFKEQLKRAQKEHPAYKNAAMRS